MSIHYTLIANKKDNVICEFTEKTGNFQQVSRILLSKAVNQECSEALEFKKHKFHYLNENGLTFLCLSEDIEDERIMAFLKDLQSSLLRQYDFEYVSTAPAFKLAAFEKQIQELVEYYETNPRTSISGQVIQELNEVKSLVVKNINTLMDRENTLELTISNSNKLKDSAVKVNNFVSKN